MKNRIRIHGELISSKNSRKIRTIKRKGGKAGIMVTKSDKALVSETNIMQQLADLEKVAEWGMPSEEDFPIKIHFKITRISHRRFDFTNIVQLLMDCMVKQGYIPDDCAKYVIPVFYPYDKDKFDPHVDVWWEPWKKNNHQ